MMRKVNKIQNDIYGVKLQEGKSSYLYGGECIVQRLK